jgi:hypothetical protein
VSTQLLEQAPLYRRTLARSARKQMTQLLEQERDRTRQRRMARLARLRAIQEGKFRMDVARAEALPAITGAASDYLGRLEEARGVLMGQHLSNMKDLLPLLFSLNGKPYRLTDHFPFEPFYATHLCQKIIWKTGRQVSKSTNQAAQGILLANMIPFFNTLFVTPLFEMVRRFSSNYVAPFIADSPIRPYMLDSSCTNSVLQRTFRNRSQMYFSFAFQNADRTRGLNCSKVAYDEIQDMDPRFIPIINETMSASKWNIEQRTGTPKTLEGVVEQSWVSSSQAEWAIQCGSCKHLNIPSLAEDLRAMMGPEHTLRDVSEREPGVVCAKCGKPVNPRAGFWLHANPELRFKFSGYHIPQLILPMHYADTEKWGILQAKRHGAGNTPYNVFMNEVCGESYDQGAKLLTVSDLKKAAVLHENREELACQTINSYNHRILAVDWGGGGQEEVSFTCAAVIGRRHNGEIDVIYGERSLTPNDPIREVQMLIRILNKFQCQHIVHDFGGAGALREVLLVQSGYPEGRIVPVAYQRVTVGAMAVMKSENMHTGKRAYLQLDKTRSLQYTCALIQQAFIKFFKYDYQSPDQRGLLHDFLSLVEDRVDSRMGQTLSTIIRNELVGPDDFAHAVNIGVNAMFYSHNYWPDLAMMARTSITQEMVDMVSPFVADNTARWDV